MSIIDTIAGWFGFTKADEDPRPPAQMLSVAEGQRWDMPDGSVAEKQAKLYAALTWIGTAVDRTAELGSGAIYSVAQQVGEPGGEDDEDLPNHAFEKLLRRPNPMQSRGEFLRDALSWYKVTGNLYLYNNAPAEGAPPDELWIVPSHMMKPIPDGNSYVRGYEFTPPGKTAEFVPKWQIIHLKTWNPLNPFVGLSAVQSLALDAYGDLAQQRFNLQLFDKDAGRFPGLLAFKHMVAQPEWEKMVKERDEKWGGVNRATVMMLRGVGDTVQWLPTAISQKEMEFLESRAFTKEEIYGKLAPGLASILAVNATEANAIAGKATLIEFGVWPLLEQLGQKFEAELLPLYGENLTGAFDDLRQTNRILDLQEQAEFAKYHTINEVRMEYYGHDPLYLDKTQADNMAADEAATEERNAQAVAQFGQPPAKADTSEKPTAELDPRGLMFVAQIGPATPLPGEKKPAPAPMLPPMNQQPGQPGAEPEAPNDGQATEELAKWEKFALARVGKAGGRDFEPRVLPLFQVARIKAALKAAPTADEVRAAFKRERETPELVNVGQKLLAAIERVEKQL